MSLAAALGALSAAERGARARTGRANVAAAAAPPRVGRALELEALLASAGRRTGDGEKSAFGSGAVVEVDLAGLMLDGDDDGDATDALAAFGREDVTEADAAAALAPFARAEGGKPSKTKRGATKGGVKKAHTGEHAGSRSRGSRAMPPAVLSAALDACVRNGSGDRCASSSTPGS